jgi:hypothetical protein
MRCFAIDASSVSIALSHRDLRKAGTVHLQDGLAKQELDTIVASPMIHAKVSISGGSEHAKRLP